MSQIIMVIHAGEFNGAITNFVDTFQNIKLHNPNVKLFVLHDRRRIVTNFQADLPSMNDVSYVPFSVKFLRIVVECADSLIIDKQVMLDLIANDLKPQSSRITLLYPSLICEVFGFSSATIQQIEFFLKTNNVIVVGNEFNRKILSPMVNYVPWLLKFSEQRLTNLSQRVPTRGVFTTKTYTKLKTTDDRVDAFDFAEYHYSRREVCPGVFFENIGKLVFEFAVLGRKVTYSPANKQYFDGLSEYFTELGVTDDTPFTVNVDASRFIGPDDVVREILSR